MYLNKAIIVGNLTRDPELKSIPSGAKVTNFSLATNRVWNDKDGQRQESTDYHNIVVFGRQAETSAQYLKKGQSALVEGRLQTRSWDDADGNKKYRTEIIADKVQFGFKPAGASQNQQGQQNQQEEQSGQSQQKSEDEDLDTIEYPDSENEEDIPF